MHPRGTAIQARTLLLDNLQSLWRASPHGQGYPHFNLAGLYHTAKRTLTHAVQGNDAMSQRLRQTQAVLDPFVAAWLPTCLAHNDFYDDQMITMPDGRIALVDFEEAGAGDPMLDVGNFLAHLRWSACFQRDDEAHASDAYHAAFKSAALDRFRWNKRDLALREAVCLFKDLY